MPAQRAVKNLIYFDLIGMLMDVTIFPSPIGHSNHLGGHLSAMLIKYVLCSTPIGRRLSNRRERNALNQRTEDPFIEEFFLLFVWCVATQRNGHAFKSV